MATQPVSKITEQQYLEHERNTAWPSEFLNGEIFRVEGASAKHALIHTNIGFTLRPEARKRGCLVYTTGRLRIHATGLYTYPDLMVVCGQPKYSDDLEETLTNPVVIFEILSRTTEGYDRGEKFDHYSTIPSLHEYITVSQHAPHIQHHLRQPNNSWVLTRLEGLDARLPIARLECELRLQQLYEDVIFDANPV